MWYMCCYVCIFFFLPNAFTMVQIDLACVLNVGFNRSSVADSFRFSAHTPGGRYPAESE